jgi:hypothetical protein
MRNIKLGFLIVVGVLLLDSCLVIPRHRTYTERKMYRNGMYIHPHIQLYKRRYAPIVPNYHPQPRQFYNPQKPR